MRAFAHLNACDCVTKTLIHCSENARSLCYDFNKMWLFTLDGFYSAVQDKQNKDVIWIRTRVKEDLTRLIETYAVVASPIEENRGTDYKYRVAVWREEWCRVMFECAEDIDYENFKDEVKETLGASRAHILSDVWWVLLQLQLDHRMRAFCGFMGGPRNNSDNSGDGIHTSDLRLNSLVSNLN